MNKTKIEELYRLPKRIRFRIIYIKKKNAGYVKGIGQKSFMYALHTEGFLKNIFIIGLIILSKYTAFKGRI